MKENFNTVIMFNAYGVNELNEIEDFDKFFEFLQEKYTKEEIVDFIYEVVDNSDESDPKFFQFYKSIPTNISDTVNDEMNITGVVEKIRAGDIQSAVKEIDKGSFEIIKRTKQLIGTYNVRISLFEKGLKMLEPYDENIFQKFKIELKNNKGKKEYENADVLFQKSTLEEQLEYFETEIRNSKSELEEWKNEIKKVISELMTVKVVDDMIKIEEDNELVDLLLERRQILSKAKKLFNKIVKN